MKRTPRITIFMCARGSQPWRWRLVGSNGEIVCQSEGYASRRNARRAALRLPVIAAAAVI